MRLRGKYIIRIGDIVQVTVAHTFVRCGYAIDIKELAEKLLQTSIGPISRLVEQCGGPPNVEQYYENVVHASNKDTLFTIHPESISDPYLDVAIGMAKVIARHRQFGGNERKIYTKMMPELFGNRYRVRAKKTVYTGTRSPPYSGSYGENEPEQGYLADAKAHVILELGSVQQINGRYSTVWIERGNVQKVM